MQDTIRVVVADDDPSIRGLLRSYLDLAELAVVGEAEDGQATIDIVRALEPDAVIMDWQMTELDGVAATRVLREEFPNLLIVMFSSRVGREAEVEALRAGVDSYLRKPHDVDRVVGTLIDLMAPRRASGTRNGAH